NLPSTSDSVLCVHNDSCSVPELKLVHMATMFKDATVYQPECRAPNLVAQTLRNRPETGRFSAGSVQPLPPAQTRLHPLAKRVNGRQHWRGSIFPAPCHTSGSTSRARFSGHLRAPPFVPPVSSRRDGHAVHAFHEKKRRL